MKKYDPKKIERRWQKIWLQSKSQKASTNGKFYNLVEFPYPSGNLHMGHWYAFAVPDIFARYKKMQGYNVMYPIGFDAFGLPAENAAIKNKLQPADWTKQNIKHMTKQMHSMGAMFDWSRMVSTIDPEYYKWTQWIFLQFYKAGLAYRAKTLVNWCPKDKTVLANEQVVDGKCDRCGSDVEQREREQWMYRITKYAEQLLEGLEKVDWPEVTKTAQRNWIGKSEGALIKFEVVGDLSLTLSQGEGTEEGGAPGYVTSDAKEYQALYDRALEMRKNPTQAEEILWNALRTNKQEHHFRRQHIVDHFIVDFLCLSKNLIVEVDGDVHEDQKERDVERDEKLRGLGFTILRFRNEEVLKDLDEVLKKISNALAPSPWERAGGEVSVEVFTTRPDTIMSVTFLAIPAKGGEEKFTGEYVTNPATKEKIPVWTADYVLDSYGTGAIMGVPAYDERDEAFAKKHNLPIIKAALTDKVFGSKTVKYRLHDWILSRQRYWGTPIPMINCDKCGYVPVPEDELPVKLPKLENYLPADDGSSPLARAEKWVKTKCPSCSGEARRETDTMDTFVDSSWYFLRYPSTHSEAVRSGQVAWDKELTATWLPVDLYTGGAEHNTMHLLYSRFFIKALHELGYVDFSEPFTVRRNHGVVLGPDGQKMSKSKGNVIDPDKEVAEYGADAVRMYLAFLGPYDTFNGPWDPNGIVGLSRFLNRVWMITQNQKSNLKNQNDNSKLKNILHKAIKKVGEDIENLHFNTAISELMKLLNEMEGLRLQVTSYTLQVFLRLLAPFAPHLAEELWSLNHTTSIHDESWPEYDPALLKEDTADFIIQIDGKTRAVINLPTDSDETSVKMAAEQDEKVKRHLNSEVIKTIFVPKKLLNLILRHK